VKATLTNLFGRLIDYIGERTELEIRLLIRLIDNMTEKWWWDHKFWHLSMNASIEWWHIKYHRDPFIILKWVFLGFVTFSTVSNPSGVWTLFRESMLMDAVKWIVILWIIAKSTFGAPWAWRVQDRFFSYYVTPMMRNTHHMGFWSMVANIILRVFNTKMLVLTLSICTAGMDPRFGTIVINVLRAHWFLWLEIATFGLYIGVVFYHYLEDAVWLEKLIVYLDENARAVPDWLANIIFGLDIFLLVAFVFVVALYYLTRMPPTRALLIITGIGILTIVVVAFYRKIRNFVDEVTLFWTWEGFLKTIQRILWLTPTVTALIFLFSVSWQWHQVVKADRMRNAPLTTTTPPQPSIEVEPSPIPATLTVAPAFTETQVIPTDTPVPTFTPTATMLPTESVTPTPDAWATSTPGSSEWSTPAVMSMDLPEPISVDARVASCASRTNGAIYQVNVDPDRSACANGSGSFTVDGKLIFVTITVTNQQASYNLDGDGVPDNVVCKLNDTVFSGKSNSVSLSTGNYNSRLECPTLGITAIGWPQ